MTQSQFPPRHRLALAIATALFASTGHTANFTVTTTSDSGVGSLRQAVLDANATAGADTITFDASVTAPIQLSTGHIAIDEQLTIQGAAGITINSSAGNNNQGAFYINTGATATIQDLIVDGFNPPPVTTATAPAPAAIENRGTLALNQMLVRNNLVGIHTTGTLTATGSTVEHNQGTGIDNEGGTITLTNSTIAHNGYSGIYTHQGVATIRNCAISGNTTPEKGGGIRSEGTTDDSLTVINSTITGNSAGKLGGGIYKDDHLVTLYNNIIAGNSVAPTTPATPSTASGPELYIAANSLTAPLMSSHNLFGINGDAGIGVAAEGLSPPPTATDKVLAGAIDTAIGPLQNNGGTIATHAIIPPNSPAIDAGNNSFVPVDVTTDQRGIGFPRVVNTTVDIGAFEEGGLIAPALNKLQITVNGGGTVTSNPAGINCGGDCEENYAPTDSVILTAANGGGATFQSWGGDCASSTTATCTLSMNQPHTVTANFVSSNYHLTINPIVGNGMVISGDGNINCGSGGTSCMADYTANTRVTLQAKPVTGGRFKNWGGACAGKLPNCKLKMNADKNVTATFEGSSGQALTMIVAGGGIVISEPTGINCGSSGTACQASYGSGETVKLTAKPNKDMQFLGWGGACQGNKNTCEVKMRKPQVVAAIFQSATHLLTVIKVGAGQVKSEPVGIDCGTDCSETYAAKTSVKLTATPDSGKTFIGWGGACSGSNKTCTVKMNATRTAAAIFQ